MGYCYYFRAVILVFIIASLRLGYAEEFEYTQYQNSYYQLETEKPFAEAIDDAIFAITERNFRVTGHLYIGQAIRERGNSEFPHYDVLLYCNLSYTEAMLALDPYIINFCPNRITIRQHDQNVIITAPLWPTLVDNNVLRSLTKKMNVMTREIVDYAADSWQVMHDTHPAATLE